MLVKDYFGLGGVDGDVGIEIEVEGVNLPAAPRGWRREHDGSLRGQDNGEYVLNKPVKMAGLEKAVRDLEERFKEAGTKVDKTYRAGIHVHVNVQQLTMLQLANMMVLYYLYENALLSTCEKHRQGNHFCLRACDADWQIETIRQAYVDGNLRTIQTDNLRYSAMNTQSLFRYGSLEFRSMESYGDFDKLLFWTRVHIKLREAAQKFDTPTQVMEHFNQVGVFAFSEEVFGDTFDELLRRSKSFMQDVQDCRDNAEDIAFCRQWGKKSLDIFDRKQNVF